MRVTKRCNALCLSLKTQGVIPPRVNEPRVCQVFRGSSTVSALILLYGVRNTLYTGLRSLLYSVDTIDSTLYNAVPTFVEQPPLNMDENGNEKQAHAAGHDPARGSLNDDER